LTADVVGHAEGGVLGSRHAMSEIGRRDFTAVLAAGLSGWPSRPALPGGRTDTGDPGSGHAGVEPGGAGALAGGLVDVPGVRVGHLTDRRRPTGCTVVLVEDGAVCGVDVRGGAPGTRETDVLDPVNSVQAVHGIVLSGGSAFGLDTASGVMRFLEEKGVGFPVGVGRVPIVPAAILFDLALGDWKIRPDAAAGYEAARVASAGPIAEGSVGAGAGATVGKLFGFEGAMKGGIGTASLSHKGGAVVAALVAVNALGDVVDPASGRVLAGARSPDGRLRGAVESLLAGETPGHPLGGQNTSIGVVATNVALTKAEATKVAQMAHDGLARAIRPVHTPWDGDTLFVLATGVVRVEQPTLLVGTFAAEAVARAVVRAVRTAKGLPGIPAAAEHAQG
jgi:L-aminopeptidase/D-esterase-like protein